jgi:hypothetical protein
MGATNLWSNNSNWDVPPASGNDLVFPTVVSNLSNQDDLAADTSFNSIQFTAGGYTISGNAIALGTGGLLLNVASGLDQINLNLDVAGTSPVTLSNAGTLDLAGAVNGAGSLTVSSPTGAGNLILGGTNSISSITIDSGTVLVNGSEPSTAITVAGGTLGGTGTLGTTTATAGQVNPGNPTSTNGILSGTSADFSGGGNLTIQVSGYTTPGTDFDQLNLSGALTAGGTSSLTVDLGSMNTPGTAQGVVLYAPNSRTGSFTTVNVINNPNNMAVSVVYDDTNGRVNLQVTDAALTPKSATITAMEGASFSGLAGSFTDADPNATASEYTAQIQWGDGTTTSGTITKTASGTFNVTGTHTYADEGPESVTVLIADTDNSANKATISSTATVSENDVLTPTASTINVTEGKAATGITVATFTDSNPAATASDFTASIDWGETTTSTGTVTLSGGVFSVTGSHTYADEGTFTVKVTVKDDTPGTATAAVTSTANVAEADSLTGTKATITATEGTAANNVTVATFTNTNLAATASDFTASIDWGDGTTSTGTVSGSSGAFSVNGSHTYSEDGAHSIKVKIADDAPGTATATVTSTANVAESDLLVTGVALSPTEGTALTGATVATISDTGSPDAATNFTATINWGDGTTSTGTVTGSAGIYSVGGDHTYADEGSFSVKVSVTETAVTPAATANSTSTATVAETDTLTATAGSISPTEGIALTGVQVASFTSTNSSNVAGDFTASIDWGDGQPATSGTVTAVSGSPGHFTVTGSHTYAEEGSFTLKATITDDGTGTAKATPTATVTVADATLTAAGVTVTPTEGVSFNGVVATFTDANSSATASDFTATITWGDGATSTGTVAAGASGGFTVSGTHTYAEEGSNNISVKIKDVGGATATASSTAKVADATLTPTAVTITPAEGLSFNGTVATFTDANPSATLSDFSATIDWGDKTTSTGTIAAGTSGGFTVSGTHTYTEEGTNAVKVTIKDVGGATTTANSTANVADAALTATGATLPASQGTVTNVTVATFTDANPNGTLSDFTATINWGDGTAASAGTITQSGSTFTVTGSHTFTTSAQFTVTVSIVDVGGSTATATDTITVSIPLTPNQKWVSQVYLDLLHRPVDPSGLANWSGLVNQGVSRTQVVLDIEASPEYLTDVVENLYQRYLGRLADPVGLTDSVAFLAAGGTVEGLSAIITGSAEFFQINGGTNGTFLNALYLEALGRPIDPIGASQATAALNSGVSREQVSAIIFTSAEYYTDLVQNYYQSYLHRPADPFGLNSFVGALQAGVTDQLVIANILGSPEYFNNATSH